METPHYYFKARLEWDVTPEEDKCFNLKKYRKSLKDTMMKVKKSFDLTEIRGAQAYITKFTGGLD